MCRCLYPVSRFLQRQAGTLPGDRRLPGGGPGNAGQEALSRRPCSCRDAGPNPHSPTHSPAHSPTPSALPSRGYRGFLRSGQLPPWWAAAELISPFSATSSGSREQHYLLHPTRHFTHLFSAAVSVWRNLYRVLAELGKIKDKSLLSAPSGGL